MDRRTLLFVVISVLIIVLYQELVLKRLAPPEPPPGAVASSESAPAERPDGTRAAPGESGAVAEAEKLAEERALPPITGERIPVETDLYRAVFSTAGGRLESLTLTRYRQ